MLSSIVSVLWVSLEGYLCRTEGAFDVESEDLDSKVILAFYCFFSCIELLSLIDVLAASVAAPAR